MAELRTADVLVVGGGLSGARICQLVRELAGEARIVLVGEEPDLPYDRPPLTSSPDSDTDLADTMQIDVRDLADDVHPGVVARGLEPVPGGWRVLVAGRSGRQWTIDARAVVAATGAAPVVPAGWEMEVLHTRPQAQHLWRRVAAGSRLLVVGGGWIGCEVAWSAARRGAQVQLLEAADQLLPGRLPAEVSGRISELLAAQGVSLTLSTPVQQARLTDGGAEVRAGGRRYEADVVLAALGVRPASGWMPEGLARSAAGAVLTDPWGRTAEPGLFAVGDVAARWSPRAAAHLPGGHWTEAFNAPASVAVAVAGWLRDGGTSWWSRDVPEPAEDAVPYIFSDLEPHRLLLVGDAGPTSPGAGGAQPEVVWREETAHGPAWTAYVIDRVDGVARLRAACAWDRPRDGVAARRAIRQSPNGRPVVDPDALADPSAGPAQCFPAPK